ncbi:hypothetical protein THASP1DRAFT_30398 [Thamnocephalis sphaerospora]|uniref:Fe2OG dioxygenase domain-containing protein n=1 Tax=Thamnocephalis sphaerospora TaxID=78915 RepID=A0A4V1IWJ7_9FUNG|nr:hypothetical protein THASP1DRAFT_30398 [Thamnocephalis sphaerospora]|eukprot:RKP07799.1 hypothetical protein THASP1DRAFT_30398 [Thamnocephalis sphaerospora]
MTVGPLPIIDIGVYLDPDSSPEQREAVVHALDSACSDAGFFYLINHGVPQKLCDEVRDFGRQFFQLSQEEKYRYKVAGGFRGYKGASDVLGDDPTRHSERLGFYPPVNHCHNGLAPDMDPDSPIARLPTTRDLLGDQDSWPSDAFRTATEAYRQHLLRLNGHLFGAIATALGVSATSQKWMQHPTLSLQFNYYRALAKAEVEKGNDSSSASLEIRGHDGKWHRVQPLSGAFVVNIGSMLSLWTGGRYAATVHRVVHLSKEPRISVAAFIEPPLDASIAPPPELAAADTSMEKYASKTYYDYMFAHLEPYLGPRQA